MAKMMGKTVNWGRWWIDRSTAGAGRAAENRDWQDAEARAWADAGLADQYDHHTGGAPALVGLIDYDEDPAPWDHAGQCRKAAADYARELFRETRP